MKKDILHLKAPSNWMNDPNGFIYYKGQYHLFYQHFPYAPFWGTMHWGHAVSEDLVHWEHQGIALLPTKDYDRNGIFSGSALEKDGRLFLYYSAVRYLEEDPENIHEAKDGLFETSQAMLISEDGRTFDNWNKKKQIIPVIRDNAIADAKDTRDPKVWEENGRYYMLLGSTIDGKKGRVVVFTSADAEHWEYLSQCTNDNYGGVIECPDMFCVGNRRVFIGSPMGIKQDGKEYGNHAVCAFAEFEPDKGRLVLEDNYRMIDYGGDLYAPQTNVDKEGRRVLLAWMRMPWPVGKDSAGVMNETEGDGMWNGIMCQPRVVEVRDDKIYFTVHPNVSAHFTGEASVEEAKESKQPMRIQAHLAEGSKLSVGGFCVALKEGHVVADRTEVFFDVERYHGITQTPYVGEEADVDIFATDNLLEVFVNDGLYVISNVVYGLGRTVEGTFERIQLFT